MKKTYMCLLLVVFVAVSVAVLSIQIQAATQLSSPYTNLSASFDGSGNGSASAGTVTMTVNGNKWSEKEGTLTLQNTGTEAALLSFSYATQGNYSSLTVAGTSASATGTYSAELAAGDSVQIKMTISASGLFASAKTGKVFLTDVKLQVVSDANIIVTHNQLGTVSVNGRTITSGAPVEVGASGAPFVASPSSGAYFIGWINISDNSIISTESSITYIPTGDASIMAVFSNATSEAWYFTANKSRLFEGLDAAITNASGATNKTIILAANGVLSSGDYTIPDGVTLLLPFDSDGTLYTTSPGYIEDSYTTPTAYRTLTMASGAKISVASGGAISVAAKVSAKMGYAGAPTSKYGHIAMNKGSSITINSGGKLYAWGFVSGTGTVTAKNGSTVYESFQVVDWRGGTASSGMLGNDKKVFLMSQYYVQNVEVPMTLESGAAINCSMIADVISVRVVTVQFLGTSGCIFNLTSGSATKCYDGSADRLILDVNGSLSISQTKIELVEYLYSINLSDYVLPINNNVTINVNNGATLTLNQPTSLLPGVEVNIANGGTMKLGSGKQLFVYDETEWKSAKYIYNSGDDYFRSVRYAVGKNYSRTNADIADAKILVNGTLDASNGYLYTTAGGANIYSTGSGVVKLRAPESSPILYEALQTGTNISYASIPVTPAKLKNADGSYFEKTSNITKAHTFVYKDGTWGCEGHAFDGDGGNGMITNMPTCTEPGVATKTCTVCQYKETYEVPSPGHDYEGTAWHTDKTTHTHWQICKACDERCNEGEHTDDDNNQQCDTCKDSLACEHIEDTREENRVEATCSKVGSYDLVTFCKVCKAEIKTENKIIGLVAHTLSYVAPKAATCTSEGYIGHWSCSVCNKTFANEEGIGDPIDVTVEKLAHRYTEELSRTPATCMASGTLVMKCASCDATETTTLQIDANAHTGNNHTSDAKPASCYEEGYTGDTVCECGVTVATGQAIPKSNHALQHYEASDATCTEDGNREFYCCENYAQCGGVFFDADGKQPVTDESQVIIPAAHKPGEVTVENQVAADCENDGSYDNVIYCTVCSTEISRTTETVTSPGHDWADATCTTAKTCGTCGATEGEPLGHKDEDLNLSCDRCTTKLDCKHPNVSDWVVVKPATCGEEGYEEKTCLVCKITIDTQIIQATNEHHYVEDENQRVPATCKAEGSKVMKCSECNDSYEDVLPIDPDNHARGDNASCTTAQVCTDCGAELEAAKGHSIDKTKAPCVIQTCSVCQQQVKLDPDAAHNYTPKWDVYHVWNECVCGEIETDSEQDRIYTIAFQGYKSGSNTDIVLDGTYAYGDEITVPTLTLGFESDFFTLEGKWVVDDNEIKPGTLLDWDKIVSLLLESAENHITIPGTYSIDVPDETIQMSVRYETDYGAENFLTLSLFVIINEELTVTLDAPKGITVNGGAVEGISGLYHYTLPLSATQMESKGAIVQIWFGDVGCKEVELSWLLYANKAPDFLDQDDELTGELLQATIDYGKAVQSAYLNPESKLSEDDKKAIIQRIENNKPTQRIEYSDYAIEESLPKNNIVAFDDAFAGFNSTSAIYGLAYTFKVNLPENAELIKAGIILADSGELTEDGYVLIAGDQRQKTSEKLQSGFGSFYGDFTDWTNDGVVVKRINIVNVPATELNVKYVTVYVQYTMDGEEYFAYSQTIEYGVSTYINNMIYEKVNQEGYENDEKILKELYLFDSVLKIANNVKNTSGISN